MTSLLNVDIVRYECSCSSWQPLSHLYFCKKCDKLKCILCVNEEISRAFCPNCMESNTNAGDSQMRKYTCAICNECPICENSVIARSLGNGNHFLQCNACQWTSRESDIPDHPSTDNWPVHTNPMEPKLGEVLKFMKELGDYEKMERDRQAQASKSSKRISNLGILQNDRFGLQSAYNLRKKTLSRPKSTELLTQPSAEVPELDPCVFTTRVDPEKIPKLEQILRQPLCGDGPLYPLKVKLASNRSLRCVESDMMLYRPEYNPSQVKPRLQCFAYESVPEIRLSRSVQLVPDQPFSFFIIVSNCSNFAMSVKLNGIHDSEDINSIDCSNFSIDLPIPCRNQAADIDDYVQRGESANIKDNINDKVIVIKGHRIGLRVDCPQPKTVTKDSYALFKIHYNYPDETPNKWLSLNFRVHLNTTPFIIE